MKITKINQGKVLRASLSTVIYINNNPTVEDDSNDPLLTLQQDFIATNGQHTLNLNSVPSRNVILYRGNSTLDTSLWNWNTGDDFITIDSSVAVMDGERFSVIYT